MNWKAFFYRRSYGWRIRHYVDKLEREIDEKPAGYLEERETFDNDLQHYATTKLIYTLISAVFYASLITSVTASIGFQINVFEEIYGIFGFTTVAILFLASRYLLKLERLDLQNSRARIVSYLTHAKLRQQEREKKGD